MRRVDDETTLREAVGAAQAVLFLHAAWSMDSMFVLRNVETWDRGRDGSRSPLFFAVDNNDPFPAAVRAWLKTQGLEAFAGSGYGAVVWLERGRVVSKLAGPRAVTPASLHQRTAELWGLE